MIVSGRALPLRWRVALAFAALVLLTAGAIAIATYSLAAGYLVDQRTQLATREAYVNARLARDLLVAEPSAPKVAIEGVGSGVARDVLLRVGETWFTSAVSVDPSHLPADLLQTAAAGSVARQRFVAADGVALAIAVPLEAVDAVFVEVAPLRQIRQTLGVLRTSLAVAAGCSVVAAGMIGWFAADRLVRPLRRLSATSVRVAEGELGTRLDPGHDPDLAPLARSFNTMLDTLEDRLDRERRFAAEVSHELRTPLATMSTAVELATSGATELAPAQRTALGILQSQVQSFERLVLDLLELARLDAGSDPSRPEPVDLVNHLDNLFRQLGTPSPTWSGRTGVVDLDVVRIERIAANLVENAERYAGGVTAVRVAAGDADLELVVEDRGPGLTLDERSRVFERFWRGATARAAGRGTGLGLAIVAQHVAVVGGSVELVDTVPVGCTFVIRVPIDWSDR